METRPFLWAGKLWNVEIPEEANAEIEKWTYVQEFVVSRGSRSAAMQAIFRLQYPGIGWETSSGVYSYDGVCDMSSLRASSVSLPLHKETNAKKHYDTIPHTNRAEDHNEVKSKPKSLFSTSSASSHVSRDTAAAPRVLLLPQTMPSAKKDRGGWMGSTSTK